jgi:hypothetical protein
VLLQAGGEVGTLLPVGREFNRAQKGVVAWAEGDDNMGPSTWKRLTALGLLAAILAVVVLEIVARRQARNSRQLVLERSANELEAILTQLRTQAGTPPNGRPHTMPAETRDALAKARHRFDLWMAENVVRGWTTRTEIVTWFGKYPQNLDRPRRDGILTMEHLLYGDRTYSGMMAVFDFDPVTSILQDWQLSYCECGYCPPILASDGQWRLEGKMLAGRIGPSREGPDLLLLPRLVPRDQVLRVRLANWAPELEYIDQVWLGVVP